MRKRGFGKVGIGGYRPVPKLARIVRVFATIVQRLCRLISSRDGEFVSYLLAGAHLSESPAFQHLQPWRDEADSRTRRCGWLAARGARFTQDADGYFDCDVSSIQDFGHDSYSRGGARSAPKRECCANDYWHYCSA